MKSFFITLLLLVGIAVAAENPYTIKQYDAYLEANDHPTDPRPYRVVSENGVMRLEYWGAAVPAPAESQLTAPAVLDIPKKYRKRDGVKWVAMSTNEMETVDLEETTSSVTNDVVIMALVELINDAKGNGAKDISITNIIHRVKSKKKK